MYSRGKIAHNPQKGRKAMSGKVTVVGNGHLIDPQYGTPEWSDEEEEEDFFMYRGEQYWLSEFMRIEKHMPTWMHQYDGYMNDSFFSGVLVKIGQGDYEDQIRAYTFYS